MIHHIGCEWCEELGNSWLETILEVSDVLSPTIRGPKGTKDGFHILQPIVSFQGIVNKIEVNQQKSKKVLVYFRIRKG